MGWRQFRFRQSEAGGSADLLKATFRHKMGAAQKKLVVQVVLKPKKINGFLWPPNSKGEFLTIWVGEIFDGWVKALCYPWADSSVLVHFFRVLCFSPTDNNSHLTPSLPVIVGGIVGGPQPPVCFYQKTPSNMWSNLTLIFQSHTKREVFRCQFHPPEVNWWKALLGGSSHTDPKT